MPIPLAFTKLLRSFESCAEAVEKLVIFRKGAQLSQLILCTLVDFILPQNLRPYVKSNKKLDIQKNPLNETVLLSTQNIRKKYG